VRPTKYNKRITIQKLTPVENDIGGWSNSWADFYSSWASVYSIKGMKKLEYAKLEYNEMYEVEMRRRLVNADGDCRVVYRGNAFQIIAIDITDNEVKLDIGRTSG
jgi:head-tail adaptor